MFSTWYENGTIDEIDDTTEFSDKNENSSDSEKSSDSERLSDDEKSTQNVVNENEIDAAVQTEDTKNTEDKGNNTEDKEVEVEECEKLDKEMNTDTRKCKKVLIEKLNRDDMEEIDEVFNKKISDSNIISYLFGIDSDEDNDDEDDEEDDENECEDESKKCNLDNLCDIYTDEEPMYVVCVDGIPVGYAEEEENAQYYIWKLSRYLAAVNSNSHQNFYLHEKGLNEIHVITTNRFAIFSYDNTEYRVYYRKTKELADIDF
jgi:hypothetical protein